MTCHYVYNQALRLSLVSFVFAGLWWNAGAPRHSEDTRSYKLANVHNEVIIAYESGYVSLLQSIDEWIPLFGCALDGCGLKFARPLIPMGAACLAELVQE